MNEYVKSDLYRYRGDTSFMSLAKEYFRNGAFRYMVAHRLVNSNGIEKAIGGGILVIKE